uniref:Resolvase domain n=1 Tax=Caulobacter sp. (strain K31) TaxID=366602 RepID=B0T7K2_CAUSK
MDHKTAASRGTIVAAQYVRMSTEHQRYSLENQMAALGVYALNHDIKIVKTYRDHGRSGVTLKKRPGLQSLLSDVMATRAPFSAVLVLDVSRWGRFQDTDEVFRRVSAADIVRESRRDMRDEVVVSMRLRRLQCLGQGAVIMPKRPTAKLHLLASGLD